MKFKVGGAKSVGR